ncbi:MATE family efflux transporter [soil metagenome]
MLNDDIGAPAHEAPLVSGSLWKAIWEMSWPLLVTAGATSLVGLVDVQMAGRLGAASQAAVGLAEQIIFIFQVFLMSVGVGTTAIVSRAYGKQDFDDADFATAQSLSLSVLIGILLTVTALLTAHYVVPLFSRAPDVNAEGNLYLTIFALYLVPFSLVCIANAAFRGIGNARIPLVIICTEVVINIAGDYLTVVYNWPIPGLGVSGIAASAVAGALIASIMAIIFVRRSQLKASLRQLLPLSASIIKRIVVIGVPAAMQRLSWALSVLGLFFVLSKVAHPTAALAAWTVGMRIEGLLFMPEMALSLAVSSIVGQNLGANRVDRAFGAGWAVTGIAVCLMGTVAVGVFLFSRELALMMSAHDPATIECTTSYLQINAIGAVGQAINAVLSGALQGAGDTKVTMWISIVSNWIIRLPLAWLLAVYMGMGANGAWIAMAASATIAAIAVAVRFKTGGWVDRKV